MLAALTEIRREGWKVAAVHAVVDAALATLLVNLTLRVVPTSGVATSVPLPPRLAEALPTGAGPAPTVETAAVAGVTVGALVLIAEFALRIRRPLVEQFESANPEVREALRTARDVAEGGQETRMAVALYEDVLERLRATSSVGLLDLRRIVLTVFVVVAVSVATVHVAVVDLELSGFGPEPGAGADSGADHPRERDYEGLNDGDAILGDAENVSAGDEELEAQLPSQGGGDGEGEASAPDAYDSGGFSGESDVEGQSAAFGGDERIEDAELIREYNLQIRSTDGNVST
jgi:hypothetical protein